MNWGGLSRTPGGGIPRRGSQGGPAPGAHTHLWMLRPICRGGITPSHERAGSCARLSIAGQLSTAAHNGVGSLLRTKLLHLS